MPKSNMRVREIVKSAGADGKGTIELGGPVNQFLNKAFSEADLSNGDTVTIVAIDPSIESYELADVVYEDNTLKRSVSGLREQRKHGTQVDTPTDFLPLSDKAEVYLVETPDQILAALNAAATQAQEALDQSLAHASAAAEASSTAASDAAAAGSQRAIVTTDKNVVAALRTQAEQDAANILTQRESVDELLNGEFAEINATIATANAKAVFRYDRSYDTDGGIRLDNCEYTSWENEELNTATRGATRKFPKKSNLVLEATTLTIYDATIAECPMWMVFDVQFDYLLTQYEKTSVFAKDGVIYIGGSSASSGCLTIIDFVKDQAFSRRAAGATQRGRFLGNISQRNTALGFDIDTSASLPDSAVTSVVAAIQPGAETDKATGLPYPTIFATTGAGLAVINPTGLAADTKTVATYIDVVGDSAGSVDVAYDGSVLFTNTYRANLEVYKAPLSIADDNSPSALYDQDTTPALIGAIQANSKVVSTGIDSFAFSRADGLTLVNGECACHITSIYNTGWMRGDVLGCWLADTEDRTISDTEFVTNGGFDTDTSTWGEFQSTLAAVAGEVEVTSTAANYGMAIMSMTNLVVGRTYYISGTARRGTGTSARIEIWDGEAQFIAVSDTDGSGTTGGRFFTVKANSTPQIKLNAYVSAVGETGYFDNISITEAIPDRSGKGNGLNVFGNITATPFAVGADTVSFSGFSANDYLQQPHNADLDVDTGDFHVLVWAKTATGTQQYAVRRSTEAGTGARYALGGDPSTGFMTASLIDDAGQSLAVSDSVTVADDLPHLWALVKEGTTLKLYKDDREIGSDTNGAFGSMTNADAVLFVGVNNGPSLPWLGCLSRLRIEAGGLSAEEISKIYHDEKHLYQAGAQSTFGGSSDNVQALDRDLVSEHMYVATSDGLNRFNGLSRQTHIDSSNSDLTSNIIKAVSAHAGSYLVASNLEVIFHEPAAPLRER